MTATKSRHVVEAVDIDHYYEGSSGWVHALSDFNIRIDRDEFLCIIGPSGCGKSTFLKMVAGLMQPRFGDIFLEGAPIEGPGLDRGVVFQEPALFPWLTVSRNIEFGLEMSGWPTTRVRERARHVIDIVELSHAADLYPYQLSGGMKHRVAVARAWALDEASLLLMDEPFSAVDAMTRTTLQDHLVSTWQAEPRTVLYVTHDIDEAAYLADRVAVLTPSPGHVAEYVTIPDERPRDRTSPEMRDMKLRLTSALYDAAKVSLAAPRSQGPLATMPTDVTGPSHGPIHDWDDSNGR